MSVCVSFNYHLLRSRKHDYSLLLSLCHSVFVILNWFALNVFVIGKHSNNLSNYELNFIYIQIKKKYTHRDNLGMVILRVD